LFTKLIELAVTPDYLSSDVYFLIEKFWILV
jgi:hypothetical protein